MNYPYDETGPHCIYDAPSCGFELPLETRISDLVANAENWEIMIPEYDRSNVELRLYNIFVAWMKKHNVSYNFLAASQFYHDSEKHDNHKWLEWEIAS